MASASESRPLIVDGSRGSRSGSGPSRDMGLAREAYSKGDPELSRFAHDRGVAGAPKSTEEGHQQEGNLIKSVVFGGLVSRSPPLHSSPMPSSLFPFLFSEQRH